MKNLTAINYWVLGGFDGKKSPTEAIDNVKAMGLAGLELTFGDALAEDITQKECTAILQYAKAQKIKLETLASGRYWTCSLGSPNAGERKKAIAFTKKYLQVAAWLDVKKILVIPGAVDVAWDASRPVVPYAEVWKQATASIRSLLPLAAKLKIEICLENVWNKFLVGPMEMKLFVDQFKSKWLGVYFDVGNVAAGGYPEHWIEILGARIKAVHFKNFSRTDCGGGLHGFGDDIEKGDVDFVAVKKALTKIKYQGPITAEMIPFSRLPDLILPDMALAQKTATSLKRIVEK
jgi:hexulose-6-phosphate isomerase